MTEEIFMEQSTEGDVQPVKRGPGRPRGKVRDQIREPRLSHDRGIEVIGDNGEILSRKRKDNGIDDYETLPKEKWREGYVYQWNTFSVYGDTDLPGRDAEKMYQNAWRPVPADRHPGYFPINSKTNTIIRGGMRLEERPKVLDDEARAEDEMKARLQMRDRNEALMGNKANLGKTLTGQNIPFKGTGTGGNAVRMAIDPALDIPMPTHEVEK